MKKLLFIFILLFSIQAEAKFAPQKISWESLGEIKIGMNVKEVEKVLAQKIHSDVTKKPNEQCYIGSPKDSVSGVYFIITHWKLAAFGLNETSPKNILTPEGLGISTPQNKILSFYPKAKVEDQPYYPGGHIYTVYSKDGKSAMRIQSDGKKVISIQAGNKEEALYEEGCE